MRAAVSPTCELHRRESDGTRKQSVPLVAPTCSMPEVFKRGRNIFWRTYAVVLSPRGRLKYNSCAMRAWGHKSVRRCGDESDKLLTKLPINTTQKREFCPSFHLSLPAHESDGKAGALHKNARREAVGIADESVDTDSTAVAGCRLLIIPTWDDSICYQRYLLPQLTCSTKQEASRPDRRRERRPKTATCTANIATTVIKQRSGYHD